MVRKKRKLMISKKPHGTKSEDSLMRNTLSDRELFQAILQLIDDKQGKKDWDYISSTLEARGVRGKYGAAYTPKGIRIIYYNLRRQFGQEFSKNLTGKLTIPQEEYSESLMKQVEAVIKIKDLGTEEKLSLLRKILN